MGNYTTLLLNIFPRKGGVKRMRIGKNENEEKR